MIVMERQSDVCVGKKMEKDDKRRDEQSAEGSTSSQDDIISQRKHYITGDAT